MLEQDLWLRAADDIAWELRQARQEGRTIPQELQQQVQNLPSGGSREQAAWKLYDAIAQLPVDPAQAAREPDDLDAIRALRPQSTPLTLSGDVEDRVLGGWLGRCAGCLLGQPVESWTRARIQGLLKETNNYPIARYLSSDLPEEVRKRWDVTDGPGPYDALHKNWINLIDCMREDDDTNYTVFSLKILERVGRDFTSEDVAVGWLTSLPFLLTCSAERVAYRNLANLVPPPASASLRNPYREWIGAQIRTDLYGWVNPCDPETAADMAWRDARISHTKNGIYGAMFAAAMSAAAFGGGTPAAILRQGLGQIPAHSRLTAAVEEVLQWHADGLSAEEAVERVHQAWDETDSFDWCHVIPNAMLVAMALLWGECDFTRTIGLAVECGFDTDCNAATAGSVLGVLLGAKALPAQWIEPLADRLQTGVHGYPEASISDLARRTVALMKR